MACDEVFTGINVRPVIARIEERRRRDPHVNFLRPGFTDKADNACACRSPHDGIIDQDNSLSLDDAADCIQLETDKIVSLRLGRRDKGAPDVFVLDKSDGVRDSGLLRISGRGVEPRIGNSDDKVGIDRLEK